MDCIFCKIANKELDTHVIYEDADIIAFDDINPQAPYHKLIVPKQHFPTINDLSAEDAELAGRMILVAKKIARDLDIAESGYRLLFNCNRQGGQEIYHIHLHLLGGRTLHWPPG